LVWGRDAPSDELVTSHVWRTSAPNNKVQATSFPNQPTNIE